MYQSQVSFTNIALDCTESRTVLTINNKKHIRMRQEKQKLTICKQTNVECNKSKVRLTSPANGKFTCQLSITKTGDSTTTPNSQNAPTSLVAMQSIRLNGKTRAHKRLSIMMKSYALLSIICILIIAQISCVAGRSILVKKLRLAAVEGRLQHYKHHMDYELELEPRYLKPLHRHSSHHVNKRALNMTCIDIAQILRGSKEQAETSAQILMAEIHKYTESRFNSTPENVTQSWNLHKLKDFLHPYHQNLDRNITNKNLNHNLSHLDGKNMSELLLKTELNKVHKTIRMLQAAFGHLDKENRQNLAELKHRFKSYDKISEFINQSRIELNNNLENAKFGMEELKIPLEESSENDMTFNETDYAKEWLIIVESISFLQYLNKLYARILEMCNSMTSV
ncbi:uncharacterized protein [Eurosta solidaginis]|uniref:uncharacterized protein n=1 Tax=Eurosta solidaginis TaxID=178769 RepID=UPI0035316C9A